mgnify:CR=1 FL=1
MSQVLNKFIVARHCWNMRTGTVVYLYRMTQKNILLIKSKTAHPIAPIQIDIRVLAKMSMTPSQNFIMANLGTYLSTVCFLTCTPTLHIFILPYRGYHKRNEIHQRAREVLFKQP